LALEDPEVDPVVVATAVGLRYGSVQAQAGFGIAATIAGVIQRHWPTHVASVGIAVQAE
jgi:hypothetical protein